ncbi:MAG: hypothetical protein HY283_05460 [Nitrospirae bacterium]|nr:hypothetical protein [Nitrospirota bacterium]
MTSGIHRVLIGVGIGLSLLPQVLFFPNEATAVPQFDARFGSVLMPGHEMHMESSYGLSCADCHVNPTGGGMRNEHGREVMLDLLPMVKEDHAEFEEMIHWSKNVAIGGDFRFMYIHSEKASTDSQDSFFPMQSDLYVAVSPTDHLTLYLQDGAGGTREYFGLIRNLPYNSYIKVGQFIPPYGLKLDDHTSFIRDKLQLGVLDQDAGVETGFADGHFFGHAAVINGSPGATVDDNSNKGFSGTAGLRSRYATIGGSYYANRGLHSDRNYAGGYAMAHLWRFSWLGEWDMVRVANLDLDTRMTGSVMYQELDFNPSDGVVLKAKYDRYDPDRTESKDELQRYTAGLDIYPYPYSEVSAQYRRNLEHPALRNDEWFVLLHLFF